MKTYYLAIDIGASSGRHILGSLENGKIALEEVYRFPNKIINKAGKRCWDCEALFNHIIKGLICCRELKKVPSFVAVDTWGVDFALIDKNKRLVGDTVSYRDSRTEGFDQRVLETISDIELYSRTGIQKQIFNTIYQLVSLKHNNPSELEEAEELLMIPDYINFLLTDKLHQEYTNATTTGLVNIKSGEWDLELIEKLGLPTRLFKKLHHAGSEVGHLSKKVRELVGFDTTVLHAPSHDTASAVLATPLLDDSSAYISSGTWSLMGIETEAAIVSDDSFEANITNEGGYGMRYRFLKNIMGLWIIQSVKAELCDKYSFSELSALAESHRNTEIRIDVNDRTFLAPESMISAIKGYCQRDLSLGELLACVYHSLAESYAETLKELSAICGKKFTRLHIVGGGSLDSFLNRLTAEKCSLSVLSGPKEATAVGNIVSQMLSNGEFSSVGEARKKIFDSFAVTVTNPNSQ